MNYTKPYLPLEDQASLVIQRGMIVPDRAMLVARLKSIGYYRLSAYWYPFRQPDDSFKPGTAFEQVWRRYAFDRQLRLMVIDAIERVEIAIRAAVVDELTRSFGPFAHLSHSSFAPSMDPSVHARLIQEIEESTSKSREVFVTHFRGKYTSETHLPLWMAAEIITFGHVFTLYRNLQPAMKHALARRFLLKAPVLDSWLMTLNFTRNLCAHHGRLWNREFPIKPLIPRKDPRWHKPVVIPNNRIFAVLTLLRQLLSLIAPQSRWESRFVSLLAEYADVPRVSMGFPVRWWECPIWEGVTRT